ncbi:uncharacterized protein DNG_01717 [Cephalotrichum gorgonifer]|uniref:Uncharacterized protein n=1 Tax=Cephalotrichum gorgonifer TaxID=2041049 RepID=A0AAE8MTR6_9PEZI|nr:uncharacterized protein DNG_01717 [Cephalotrichum gorgonifer]
MFLMGEPYPYNEEDLKPPKPRQKNSDYDEERLVRGIAFVDQALRSWERKHPQVRERTLIMYKGDIMNQLEAMSSEMAEDPDDNSVFLSYISLYERVIYDRIVVDGAPDLRALDPDGLPRKLIELRQYVLAARYGEKLDECSWRLIPRIRTVADFRRREGWDRYWHRLFARIELREQDPHRTWSEIGRACHLLGMNCTETLLDIERYVSGCDLVHKSADECMRSEKVEWPEVADAMGRDLHDLVSIYPEYCPRSLSWLRESICEVALKHFFAPREFPLLTGAWFPRKMFTDEEELAWNGLGNLNDVYYTRGLYDGGGPIYMKGPM